MEEKIKEVIKEWFRTKNTKALCKYFFKEDLTRLQEEIVREVAFDEHKRIVICCMTRYGKSWCVAMGTLLWIILNENKKLVIVAPTIEKTTIIRNYIAFFIARNPFFSQLLDLDKTGFDKIKKEVSKRRMTWKNGIEMRTLSAEGQGEQLMGFGADKLIVDESCDVAYGVYQSKISRMLGDNPDSVYIEIGNPNHRNNQMYEHWTNPLWKKIHIGWKEALKEGRISETFLAEQKEELGEDSMFFKILYDAEFPEESEDALFRWEWIENAFKKESFINKQTDVNSL